MYSLHASTFPHLYDVQAYEDLLRLQSVNSREVNSLLQRKVCGTCQGVERAGYEPSGWAPGVDRADVDEWRCLSTPSLPPGLMDGGGGAQAARTGVN